MLLGGGPGSPVEPQMAPQGFLITRKIHLESDGTPGLGLLFDAFVRRDCYLGGEEGLLISKVRGI